MVSVQLDNFDFDQLKIGQFNLLIEQNNSSSIGKLIFNKMSQNYNHTYYIGDNSNIKNEIPKQNHFNMEHYQYQLTTFYEQIKQTTNKSVNNNSLLVIKANKTLIQKLVNFNCLYDIIQNRKTYNFGILLITDCFPKKFDLLKKQLNYSKNSK